MELPITFLAGRRRLLLIAAGAAGFVAVGFWVRGGGHWIVDICIGFFGLCGLIALISLHPRASFLTLTIEGFWFASLFRRHFVPWNRVAQFIPFALGRQPMVGWIFVETAADPEQMRRIDLSLTGVDAALPETYGQSGADLARLMNELRAKHARLVPGERNGS